MKKRTAYLSVLILLFAIFGCRKTGDPNLRDDMRDSYKVTYALFNYVWSPKKFSDPANREEIVSLLNRLASNFHNVERTVPIGVFEPGFLVTLQVNRALLKDAQLRFEEGEVEYAGWRLRGLVHNCVSCHTRYHAAVTFIGDAPKSPDNSLESEIAVSEFLVASRQFDLASAKLIDIARTAVAMPSAQAEMMHALKLWLVVKLRMRADYAAAAETLGEFAKSNKVRNEERDILSQWSVDLHKLAKDDRAESLSLAREYLSTFRKDMTIGEEDANLVSSLRAATILHNILPTLGGVERRQATYLLGAAYFHIEVRELGVFRNLYTEQTIREFPNTEEARKALVLYEQDIKLISSGSAGLNVSEEDQKKLRELRNLAYGSPEVVLPDSVPPVQ